MLRARPGRCGAAGGERRAEREAQPPAGGRSGVAGGGPRPPLGGSPPVVRLARRPPLQPPGLRRLTELGNVRPLNGSVKKLSVRGGLKFLGLKEGGRLPLASAYRCTCECGAAPAYGKNCVSGASAKPLFYAAEHKPPLKSLYACTILVLTGSRFGVSPFHTS